MTEKELAAFYPYKVFCTFKTVVEEKKFLFGKTFERVLMPLDLHYLFGSPKRYEHIKPVLFPLSMLTQEITINGETFVPIKKIKTIYYNTPQFFEYVNHWIKYYGIMDSTCEYVCVVKLFEWKFDVFGLIEKGDAIAVTNEFNPYK